MPRTANRFTIAQLENLLSSKRHQLDALARERNQLQKQLDALDNKIHALGGGKGGMRMTAGGRARNEKSLVESIEEVLTKSGKPTSVSDILEGVQASGYRSNSANFRGIVNQTLIKERKRFANAGRGMYGLKK
jgi:septal ring factor EnvC (AmiA/AmiB activator)